MTVKDFIKVAGITKFKDLKKIRKVISVKELRNGRTDEEQYCFEQNTESLWD